MEEMNFKETELSKTAYAKYLNHWMSENNLTLMDIFVSAQRWAESCCESETPPAQTPFLETLKSSGIPRSDGSVAQIPSYEEFVGNQYMNTPLMVELLSNDLIAQYMKDTYGVTVFTANSEDVHGPHPIYNYLKFWSNCMAEFHEPGGDDINEEDLPAELFKAYHCLWSESYGGLTYLVETPKGYGVALCYEYVSDEGAVSPEVMRSYWMLACCKAALISNELPFQEMEVLLGENAGDEGGHLLVVVFPAGMRSADFRAATHRLDEMASYPAENP